MQINFSVTRREITSINGGGKRERAQLWHSHNLSQKLSLSLSLAHSLSDPLCHSDTGLRQAMEILRLVGIKRLSVEKCKNRKEPLRAEDRHEHLTQSLGQS